MVYRIFSIIILSHIFVLPVFAVDFSAPLIELQDVELPKTNNAPIYIEVVVDDDSDVDAVKLFYRPVNSSKKFLMTKMRLIKVGKNKYFVELPASVFSMKGLDFYVEARDKANNVSQEPFPKQPKQIYFTGLQCGPNTTPCVKTESSWGGGISYGGYSVDDPDGDTSTATSPSYSLYYQHSVSRRGVAWLGLSYQEFLLPYSRTEIGQEVTSISIDAIHRWYTLSPSFRGWIGAGLGIGVSEMKDRWTSNDGFIEKEFDNRNQIDYGVIVDFGFEVKLAKGNSIGLRGMVYDSQNFGVNRDTLGIFIKIDLE